MEPAYEMSDTDRRRWETLAREGILDGMFNLGLGIQAEDPAEAQRSWRTAESGHVLSMYSLGVVLADENPQEEVRWYEQAAAHGYPSAYFNLESC